MPAEASINGSKTNLMKLPPPQSGHSNRAFNLLAANRFRVARAEAFGRFVGERRRINQIYVSSAARPQGRTLLGCALDEGTTNYLKWEDA